MTNKNPVFTGTLILAFAGIFSRILGFFNRIYLSGLIGAKELGIYQLIFPVYTILYALCCHWAELSLSRMTAALKAKKDTGAVRHLLFLTSCFSLALSLILSLLLYRYSELISRSFLHEPSCAVCLRLMSFFLPFSAVRACIHGYFLGIKKPAIHAADQLVEQTGRIFSIRILSSFSIFCFPKTALLAVAGMVIGEIAASLYTVFCCLLHFSGQKQTERHTGTSGRILFSSMLRYAIPLAGNKFSITLAAGAEAVLIPSMLTVCYHSRELALGIYGVLTGMSIPFLMFPAALVNSLGIMLLPAISESVSAGHFDAVRTTTGKTIHFCLLTGIFFLFFFLIHGKDLGLILFHNPSAGDFLMILSFLCPFLYLAVTCSSILQGLGAAASVFFCQLSALLIRIPFILFAVPEKGINGYLTGLLISYLFLVFTEIRRIRTFIEIPFSPVRSILIPSVLGIFSAFLSRKIMFLLSGFFSFLPVFHSVFSGLFMGIFFLAGILICEKRNSSFPLFI